MEFATQSIAWQYIHPVNLLQKSHLNAVPPKMIARLKEMRYLCDHNYDKVVTVGGSSWKIFRTRLFDLPDRGDLYLSETIKKSISENFLWRSPSPLKSYNLYENCTILIVISMIIVIWKFINMRNCKCNSLILLYQHYVQNTSTII